jgi:hypothetical protein
VKQAMLLALLILSWTIPSIGQTTIHHRGTIVRMRLADCVCPEHRWMAAVSGSGPMPSEKRCPEYVLVSDKVIYTIIGKRSDEVVPLAEVTEFRLQKSEMLIRVDATRKEAHFQIKEMSLGRLGGDGQILEPEHLSKAVNEPDGATISNH